MLARRGFTRCLAPICAVVDGEESLEALRHD